MRLRAGILLCAVISMWFVRADGESRNEIAFLLGSRVAASPNSAVPIEIGKSLAFQATYAHVFFTTDRAAFAMEVPFIALPSQDIRSAQPTAPRNFASIFITPGIRVRLAPRAGVSPFFSIGGGYARFAESTTLLNGSSNSSVTGTNKGALQFGGGLDVHSPVKILVPLHFRAEVRDLYSGQPRLNILTAGSGLHHVIVSGGVVLSF